ncbi:hypothetical protein R70331_27885 [Paenibacillus sp. FSL R7-0331]|nr:hypothetical protein R70331_27885 [Paenibacillus sp. FSL R7-0331]
MPDKLGVAVLSGDPERMEQVIGEWGDRLSQISELVGYEDEKYFSRVFKKATGLTPREYRKQ